MHWTKPHYGVQHGGTYSPARHWVTVEDYGTFARLARWFPGCGFSPMESTHDNAEDARQAGECWLRGIA